MSRRLAVVLLVPIVLVAACSGDDDAASSTTFAPPLTNPPLTTTAPTTTDPPSTTEVSITVVDSTINTTVPESTPTTTESTVPESTPTTAPGDYDWVAIVQGLYDTLDDINADPDVSRIDEFCVAVESPCRDQQGAQIEALVRDGWRVVDVPRTEVLTALLNTTVDGKPPLDSTLVVLEVELTPAVDGGQVVDADGNVLFEITADGGGDGRATWFVRHVGQGEWRLFELL